MLFCVGSSIGMCSAQAFTVYGSMGDAIFCICNGQCVNTSCEYIYRLLTSGHKCSESKPCHNIVYLSSCIGVSVSKYRSPFTVHQRSEKRKTHLLFNICKCPFVCKAMHSLREQQMFKSSTNRLKLGFNYFGQFSAMLRQHSTLERSRLQSDEVWYYVAVSKSTMK